MTLRRKTWVGVGLFAIAGSALPGGAQANVTGAATLIGHPAPTGAPALSAHPLDGLLLAAGGEGGGEGGGALETYAADATAPAYDAKGVIAAYAAGVRATYEESLAGARNLADAVDALLADPTEATLAAARKAWVDARPAYTMTEAFRFYDGPIEALEGEINAWPINEAFIDYVEGAPTSGIVNNPDMEISLVKLMINNAASDESDVTLGWHAVEFLLWGQDASATGPGNRPVSDYIAGQGNNDRRRLYLKTAMDRLVSDLSHVNDAWEDGLPDNYRAVFLALPQKEAVGRILNGIALLAGSELMAERMAVGLDSGDQEDEQSCFSDTTHADFVYDMKGIENVWKGSYPKASGAGFREAVVSVDGDLAKRIDQLMDDATQKIGALGDPWDQVLASPEGSPARADAEAAVAALGDLATALKEAGDKLGVIVQVQE